MTVAGKDHVASTTDTPRSYVTIGQDDSSCFLSEFAIPSNALNLAVHDGLGMIMYMPTQSPGMQDARYATPALNKTPAESTIIIMQVFQNP